MQEISLSCAISPCPNDTFAFHGLLTKTISDVDLSLDFSFLDIENLNESARQRGFDLLKVSVATALQLQDQYVILPTGAALGFRVGPILLSSERDVLPSEKDIILCPGMQTTATLLFRKFFPACLHLQPLVFSEIMPCLQQRKARFGIVIHEGRFVYQQNGLHLIADLGDMWHRETSLPLPLGCLILKKSLDHLAQKITTLVQRSIQFGFEHRNEAEHTMLSYAQELSAAVCWQHVDLYVNEMTRELNEQGWRAFRALEGLIDAKKAPGS